MIGRRNIDLAVIGSGVTGMAAAVTAAEGGARVAVFETRRFWEAPQLLLRDVRSGDGETAGELHYVQPR